MTNTKRLLTLLMVLTLCVTAFAGCRKKNIPDDAVDPSTSPTTTPMTQEDTMGTISYVGDTSIAISEYTTDEEITDFASLDSSALTATDTTRYITVDNNTEYYIAAGAGVNDASKSDLSIGDFITVATVNGVLQITRLDINPDNAATGDNGNGGSGNGGSGNGGSGNSGSGGSGSGNSSSGGSGSGNSSSGNNGGGAQNSPEP